MYEILSFQVKPLDEHGPEVLTITPVLDGVSLIDLISRFEREHGMEPPGGYGGLVPVLFRYGPLDRYFLGQSDSDYFIAGSNYYLLGCQCGEVGCWPLSARISTTDREVMWDHFTQEHRPSRDYSGFGPFRFDLVEYKRAIAELAPLFQK